MSDYAKRDRANRLQTVTELLAESREALERLQTKAQGTDPETAVQVRDLSLECDMVYVTIGDKLAEAVKLLK